MRKAFTYHRGSLILRLTTIIDFVDFFKNRKQFNYYYSNIKHINVIQMDDI